MFSEFNMNIRKNELKPGTVGKVGMSSLSQKSGTDAGFKLDKIKNLKKKDKSELTKKEKRLLTAEPAIQRTTKRNKPGKFSSKNRRIKRKQASPSNFFSKVGGNLNAALNVGAAVPIQPFTKKKSKTGIASAKNIEKGIKNFSKKLDKLDKDIVGKVNVEGKTPDDTKINVKRDYQKTSYEFNPKSMKFESTGWKADIPESFKKQSEDKYVAPEKRYKKYDYEYDDYRDSDDDVHKEKYDKFNPVEVYMGDDKNQLERVEEKKTYKKYEEEDEDVDTWTVDGEVVAATRDDEEETKKWGVYADRVIDYFGTGALKSETKRGEYMKERDERWNDYGESYEEKVYSPYVKEQTEYGKSGVKKSEDRYGVLTSYESDEEEFDDEEEETERERRKRYKKQEKEYTDIGRLKRKKERDVYEAEDEKEWEEESYEKTQRDKSFVKRDILYDKGLEVGRKIYAPYQSEVETDSGTTKRDLYTGYGETKTKVIDESQKEAYMKMLRDGRVESIQDNYDGTYTVEYVAPSETDVHEIRKDRGVSDEYNVYKDTALRREERYNPETGKFERIKFW